MFLRRFLGYLRFLSDTETLDAKYEVKRNIGKNKYFN